MSTVQDLMGSGMSPQLAGRLGNSPKNYPGNGTSQNTATVVRGQALNLLAPADGNTAFVLSSTFSTGRPVFVWNLSDSGTALLFPPLGGAFDGGTQNAAVEIPPNRGGIVQLVDGSGTPAEEWFSLISGSGGGGGLPPGGYLYQPLVNDGTSGGGEWGNTLFARTSAPDSPPDNGTNLVLFGEQGGTGSGAGYGASVSAGGGRHDTGDGSYGGNATAQGGNAGVYGGGYLNTRGANSDSGPGGVALGGGYSTATPNTIIISGMPPFDPGANESTIQLQTGFNTYRAGDIDLIANSAADIINGNIKVTLNANTGAAQGNLYLFGLPTAVTDLPDDALWIEPGTGAVIAAPGTGTGGGGGAAIEPESGPGIKISAITAAAFPMGADDVLTGLQDGANANFTQTQILGGRNAVASNANGEGVSAVAGAANGTGYGGNWLIHGGASGNVDGSGAGYAALKGGVSGFSLGGSVVARGAYQLGAGIGGGYVDIDAGAGYTAGGDGGALRFSAGAGYGAAYFSGNISLSLADPQDGAATGNLLLNSIPTADPSVVNAIWNNNSVPMFSGVTNYSGTTTITGIGTKTITIVNGIITSIA